MSSVNIIPQKFFNELNANMMHLVEQFYAEDIQFYDPIVHMDGLKEMRDYYIQMYKNVQTISWEFPDEVWQDNKCTLSWKMTLTAKDFNGNKPLTLDGISLMKFNPEGKACYHRDYFDMGAFVYEWVPVLGSMVRFVKKKMTTH